ncbi:MAG: transposase [Candidatus Cloacimonadaceae bacterium]
MKRRKPYVRYSEAFKRTVVEEVETGIMTANQATKYYGLGGRDTIYRWIKTYGMNEEKGRKVIIMTRKEETKLTTARRRIAELEKELSEAKLRALAWESMVEVAEEMGIPLKKKPWREALSDAEKKLYPEGQNTASREFAKSMASADKPSTNGLKKLKRKKTLKP